MRAPLRRAQVIVWAVFTVFWIIVGGFSMAAVVGDYSRTSASAVHRQHNLTHLLTDQVETLFHYVEAYLERSGEQFLARKRELMSFDFLIGEKEIEGLFFVGLKGEIESIIPRLGATPTKDEFSTGLFSCTGSPFFIGEAIPLSTGHWAIPAFRRLNDPSGKCLGYIGTSVSLGRLDANFRVALPSPDLSVMLVLDESVVLYRFPYRPELIGRRLSPEGLRTVSALRGQDEGQIFLTSPYDGEEKLFSFKRARALPLGLTVYSNRSVIFADWYQRTTVRVLVLALMLAVTLMITLSIQRRLRLQIRYLRNLQASSKRSEQAARLQGVGQFASHMARDFQGVIAKMKNSLDKLKATIPAGQDRGLERLSRSIRRADLLVRRLVTVAQMGQDVGARRIDLVQVAREVYATVLEQKPESVNLRLDISQPTWVLGDSDQLFQSLINLCSNAIDATAADGGQVTLKVSHSADGQRALVEIIDQGIGISEKNLPLIFEPFFTTKSSGRGSGLGLSIARELVHSMQGSISVESTEGKGTKILIELPMQDQSQGLGLYPPGKVRAEANGSCLLLVEDDAALQEGLKSALVSDGHMVVAFARGEEAKAWFVENGRECSAAILDYNLPDISGVELACFIRSWRPELPVLLMSGLYREAVAALDEARAKVKELEGVEVMPKPIGGGELTQKLRRLMHGS